MAKDDQTPRPTRDQQREEARRQRKEIEQKMARRRRKRSIALGALALAVVVGAGALLITALGNKKAALPAAQALLSQAEAAEKTAGCSPVATTPDYDGANVGVGIIPTADGSIPDQDHTHIGGEGGPATPPALSTYPTIPAASGPHDPSPLPGGVYESPPSLVRAIHSLEHGGTIVWYSPGTSGPELTELLDFYGESDFDVNRDRVIVAPYDYPDEGDAGKLPAGTQMAVVAWHRLETCQSVSLAAAFNFTARYGSQTFDNLPYLGDAPEPAGSF